MKNFQLTSSIVLFTISILIYGCVNEPCLDIKELDRQSAITKEWYVNDSIGNQIIVDKNEISQTLTISSRHQHKWDDIVEDDCGNVYGSFYFTIQYNTSLSPLHFMVDIHGSGLSEDGFYLKLTVTDTKSVGHKSTTYDFVKGNCRENNANIEIINGTLIDNKFDSEVLMIDFKNTNTPNDIKTVYYAKGYGIIKFVEENGNEFEVQ
ncbi:hypothetical protein [Marinifilum sp.]|uniref:hypothetical protein n=1 Tax=Marinifilum sp. TaxID=2033137 RepID=UPI003BAD4A80